MQFENTGNGQKDVQRFSWDLAGLWEGQFSWITQCIHFENMWRGLKNVERLSRNLARSWQD